MTTYDSSARNVEEAIAAGLEHLGVSISDVSIDILQEGSKGLFGLFGSKQAKVRLTLKDDNDDPFGAITGKPQAEKPATRQRKEPAKPQAKPQAEKPATPQAKPQTAQPKTEKPAKPTAKPQTEKPAKPYTAKPAAQPLNVPKAEVEPAPQADPMTAQGRAQQFLQELTRLMGVEVSVNVETDSEGNVKVNMSGDTLGILIGRRGETLDAIQYLTSLKVNRGQEGYTRVTLDTENYRAKREEALTRLANRMANRAVKTGRRVSLEPMNPYERRILHSALQNNSAVDTHSEGEEPNRHVVITLKKPLKAAQADKSE